MNDKGIMVGDLVDLWGARTFEEIPSRRGVVIAHLVIRVSEDAAPIVRGNRVLNNDLVDILLPDFSVRTVSIESVTKIQT